MAWELADGVLAAATAEVATEERRRSQGLTGRWRGLLKGLGVGLQNWRMGWLGGSRTCWQGIEEPGRRLG